MKKESYPLCWPDGWKRTTVRKRAGFGSNEQQYGRNGQSTWRSKKPLSVSEALGRISDSLERMGISENSIIVSTNVPVRLDGMPRSGAAEPSDPGAAVYWMHNGKQECMAVDRYDRVADNLAAIAATLEALRAIERHGGGEILERAFRGFAALPEAIITARPWREVFEVGENDFLNSDAINTRFKALAFKRHPDRGGTNEQMAELNHAREEALAELAS